MASALPMNRPVPIAPPSPIITICVLPRPRRSPVSRSMIGRDFMRYGDRTGTGLRRATARSVVVRNAGVVPGADHTDDVDTVSRGCLERVQLLAWQENDIASPHSRFAILGPQAAFAREHDDRFLV